MDRALCIDHHAKFEVEEKCLQEKKTKNRILHLSSCGFNCSSRIRNPLLLIGWFNWYLGYEQEAIECCGSCTTSFPI